MNAHRIAVSLLAAAALLAAASTVTAGPTEALLQTRKLAYDANFHNDQAGLERAIADFERLARDSTQRPYALYYAAWTEWALTASHLDAEDRGAATLSARSAVEHARAAAESRPDLADFQCMLANALVAQAWVDSVRARDAFAQIAPIRDRAVELGPDNPRVMIMDAGIIFNTPAAYGGSQEKGLERWRRAMERFEEESKTRAADPRLPRWGRAEAYGWFGSLYMAMTPPQVEKARQAAARALELRPDYWWVKERLLPRLKS